jgi:hypothetical protein
MKVHASTLTMTLRARSNYKIRASFDDGCDESIHHLRTIATIAIEKYNDLTLRRD